MFIISPTEVNLKKEVSIVVVWELGTPPSGLTEAVILSIRQSAKVDQFGEVSKSTVSASTKGSIGWAGSISIVEAIEGDDMCLGGLLVVLVLVSE